MEKKNIVWRIVLIVSIVIFLISATVLAFHLFPRKNEVTAPPVSSQSQSSEPTVELVDNPINFAEQQAKNPEICGWISIPGTNVDYPILQSSITKENYYLDHNVDKRYSARGAIYMQKVNSSDFSDPNTVIYGHNMKNGTMFGTLKKYRNKEFFNKNRYIYVYTPGHILTYEIYSAFVYDDRHILNSFDFSLKDEFADFISQTVSPKSMTKNVLENISVDTDDKIITLSTCTGIKTERYLVVGVLIDDRQTK